MCQVDRLQTITQFCDVYNVTLCVFKRYLRSADSVGLCVRLTGCRLTQFCDVYNVTLCVFKLYVRSADSVGLCIRLTGCRLLHNSVMCIT